jgi:serine/threonine-protein kinase
MSYCLNPACPQPKNPSHVTVCQACGSKLRLHDRYQVVKAIAQGGFGATFVAADMRTPEHQICVIKQLRPVATAPEVLRMARDLFDREARTLKLIGDHPQIPQLLDYFEENNQFYVVQEYVKGWTLQQEVKKNGPFSEAGVKQFLTEILPVLHYIHGRRVIHRDIKPANIIRRQEDRKLVLIDFGAVKNQVSHTVLMSSSENTALTSYAIGTPGYAPAEQLAMRPVYASDIYALGMTCVYLLTGKPPKDLDYHPTTGETIWQKGLHLSESFTEVLKKMLEVSVRHRYQSAEEALKGLDMAPYMDSLAQGLTAKPSKPVSSSPERTGRMSFTSPSGFNRREVQPERFSTTRSSPPNVNKGNNSGVRSFADKSHTTSQSQTSSSHTPKKTTRWTAVSVLTAYKQNKRDFGEENLSHLNLQQADLSGVSFYRANLVQANFSRANLSQTNFGGANLHSSVLRDTNLVRAYFGYADLEGADLRGADLSYAYFNYANLRGANLCGANLTGAKISEEQLAQAKTNWSTVLPSGKRGFW